MGNRARPATMFYRILTIPLLIGAGLVAGYLLATARFDQLPESLRMTPDQPAQNALPSGARQGEPVVSDSAFATGLAAHRFAEPLGEPELQAQILRALAMADQYAGFELAKVLVKRLVDRSATGAIRFVTTRVDRQDSRYLDVLRVVFRAVAQANLELAITGIEQLDDPQQQYVVASDLLLSNLVRDTALFSDRLRSVTANMGPLLQQVEARNKSPSDSFNQALALDVDPQQFGLLMDATSRWAKMDPAAALQALEAVRNPQQKEALLGRVLMEWAQRDAEAALAAARASGPNRANQIVAVLGIMAQKDPESALRYAEELETEFPGFPMMASVVNGWAQHDPRAAAAYVEALPVGRREPLVMNVANFYQQRHPKEALLWAIDMDTQDPSTIAMLGNNYAQQNPDDALVIAESQPAGTTRNMLLEAVAQVKARRDPAGTLAWIDRFRGEETYARLQLVAVTQWASIDPEGAVGYVKTLQTDRDPLMSQVVAMVVHRDTALAQELIDDMASGPGRDSARSQLATRVAMSDVNRAMTIIDSIDDERIAHQARVQSVIQAIAGNPGKSDDLVSRYSLQDDPDIKEFMLRRSTLGPFGNAGMNVTTQVQIPRVRQR